MRIAMIGNAAARGQSGGRRPLAHIPVSAAIGRTPVRGRGRAPSLGEG